MGIYSFAEKYFKKLIEKDPNIYGYYMHLGSLYFDSGRYSEALEMFKQSLKLRPSDLKILLLRPKKGQSQNRCFYTLKNSSRMYRY